MPAIADPTLPDGRITHGCYMLVRTLAFPPKQKHLGAIRRGFTRQLTLDVAEHGFTHSFAAAGIKAAQNALSDVVWAERQLRANPKLRTEDGSDLDASNSTTQWVLDWKRKREADLVKALRDLRLDQPAGGGDIQTILAEFHNAQNAATRDETNEADSSIEPADGNAADSESSGQTAAAGGADE